MPVEPTDTGYSPGAYEGGTPNTPGAPVYVENNQFRITSSNDVLVLTSNKGGPVSIDIADAFYSPSALAEALENAMNDSETLTGLSIEFTVSYNTATFGFTIDSGIGNTIAYTNSGSDAGATFGFTADAVASQEIASDTPTEASDTITFDIDTNDNDSSVEFAIYDNTQEKYISATGGTDASEVWQTAADWSGGGQSGRVTVYGLSQYTTYTYKVKARNILNESDFGASSADMYCNILVDWGTASDVVLREVSTGNTKIKIDGVTIDSTEYDIYSAGGYGAIAITFVTINNSGDGSTPESSVGIEFSEDNVSFYAGTHFFTITSDNDVIAFTSDEGSANIDIPDGDYDTADDLATALETAMNANDTLTGTGTITFEVTFSAATYKYTIDSGAGHTITFDYFTSDAAYTFGFSKNPIAARTITSDESRGENPRDLASNMAGVEHTIYWDSYTDSGKSEKDSTVYVRLTPYDAVALGGDAGEPRTSNSFAIDNTPVQPTVINVDTFTFGKDTTPEWSAIMTPLKGGIKAFFRLTITDFDGTTVDVFDSSFNITGWWYQKSGSSYSAVPIEGVSGEYIDGINKVKYILPAGEALTADNDRPYNITLEEGEIRDR